MSTFVRRALVSGTVMFSLGAFYAEAQDLDPRGVFFHSYEGSGFGGLEWITIVDQPGDRRYEFNDIRSITPFSGSISESGVINWDTGPVSGSGRFSDADTAFFQARFGSAPFTSRLWRAPRTTSDFITELESREIGRSSLAGEYRVTIEDLDPQTGELLATRTDTFTVDVIGDTIRLTEGDGDYVQGVFESEDSAGFRVVQPQALLPRYESFDGSETNRLLNLMGDLRFDGEDAFTATMLLQTLNSPGSQTQYVEHYTAVRVPAPGAVALVCAAPIVARRRRGEP
ncbi:MAG: hypothetical protein AAGG07_05010 [Planctomycetota bacterium]